MLGCVDTGGEKFEGASRPATTSVKRCCTASQKEKRGEVGEEVYSFSQGL